MIYFVLNYLIELDGSKKNLFLCSSLLICFMGKCYILIKNPYRINTKLPFYSLWNKFINFIEIWNFQNYFLDFDKNEFERKQAKMIFDEIGSLLEKKDFINASKHLNEHLLNVI